MINYKLKAELLNSQDFQDYLRFIKIFNGYFFTDKITIEQYRIAVDGLEYLEQKNPEHFKEYKRLANSHFQRVTRLKKKVTEILSTGHSMFITLTFKDEVLHSTSDKSRRRYVQEFLTELNCTYCANIDFGKRNHREHYHCLIGLDKIDYSLWNKRFGAINGQVVHSVEDNKKLARYIAKLTNHAIKETTKRNAIMYDRLERRLKKMV